MAGTLDFMFGGRPLKLAAQTFDGDFFGLVTDLTSITTETYVDLINVTEKGVVYYFAAPRNLDIELIIDGTTATRPASYDNGSANILISAANGNSYTFPPLPYEQSLRIRVKRKTGYTTAGTATLHRARIQ